MSNVTNAIQFETQFPNSNNVICNNLQSFNAIMSDIDGFLKANNIMLNQCKNADGSVVFTTTFMSVPRTIVVLNDKIIITTYYESDDVETMVSEIRWSIVRRIIASLIRAA